MPIGNRRFDIQIGGKGYMLDRGSFRGRAWQRTGASDSPGRRSATDVKYGELADEIDHPEVWDDWSEGYGQAYRRAGENTYHWAENFDARFPRQLVHCQNPYMARKTFEIPHIDWPPYLENVDEIIDSSLVRSKVILLSKGGVAVAYPTATTFKVLLADYLSLGDDGQFLHPAATYGSYIYFGISTGTMFLGIKHNGAFIGGGIVATMPGYRFAVTGNQLWRVHGPSVDKAFYLQNCGDPSGVGSASNWGATYNIGDYQSSIKDITGFGEQLFLGTEIGLYAGDQSGTFVNVLPIIAKQVHPDNCRDLAIWDNSVVVQHIAGVFAYNPFSWEAQVEDISPPRADRSPVRGHVRAVRGYGRYLYGGIFTGSQSWLLAGERKAGTMVWHTLQRFPHQIKIGRMHIDGITTATGDIPIPNHFWVAADASIVTSGTAPVYWWPIPTLDGNPLGISPSFSPNYIGSARMDLGAVDWGAPGTPKVYRSVEVWADNLASSAQWANLYYSVDNESTRHLLGTTAKSPKDTLYFPSGEGSFVTGQSIALSLESFTASACVTPIYRAIVLRGSLRPKSVDQITAVINLADNQADRQGSPINRPGSTMLTELRGFAQSNSPQQLIDLTGAMSYVNVMAPIQESETYQVGDNYPEMAAVVNMSVVDFG